MSDTVTSSNSTSTIPDSSTTGNSAILKGSAELVSYNSGFSFAQKITPTGLNARQNNDGFGKIISQGDGLLVVGVPAYSYSNDGSTVIDNTGCVWVFREQSDGSWSQEQKLGLSKFNSGVQFGFSVETSNQDIFVGSPYYNYDGSGENESDQAGAVFHYTYDSTNGWTLAQTIVAAGVNGRNPNDWFGWSITVNGSDMFIGAPGHQYDSSGAGALDQAGAVFHYTYDSTNGWTYSEKIVGMGPNPRSAADNYGTSVLYDGTRLLVQAKGYKFDAQGSNSITGAGAVFVMNYSTGSAVYEGRLISNNRTANLNFGNKIDINNSNIVISGSANRIHEEFSFNDGAWSEISSNIFQDLVPATLSTPSYSVAPTTSLLSPYGDHSTTSLYYNTSAGKASYTITPSEHTATVSFWTMFDNTKVANALVYPYNNGVYSNPQSTKVPSSTILNYLVTLNVFNLPVSTSIGSINHLMELGFPSQPGNTGSNTPIFEGVWYHIAVTYNGGIATLFVNGVKTMTSRYTADISTVSSFIISDMSYSNTEYFSDVRYYPDQIASYTNFTPPTTAYAESNGYTQSDSALYINGRVASGDSTITKVNFLNQENYIVDQPTSGTFLIDNSAMNPKGRSSAVRGGSFGHKIVINGTKIAVSSPADSTDILDNSPSSMTGAVYTFDISGAVSNATKNVSALRGIKSLYFADNMELSSSGVLTTYSPRMQSQVSSIIQTSWVYNFGYPEYYAIWDVYLISGVNETFGSTPTQTTVWSTWYTATGSYFGSLPSTYSVNPVVSNVLTNTVNTDYVTSTSYMYSTTAVSASGYSPTISSGALQSYPTPAVPSVYITSPGTSNTRNAGEAFGASTAISDSQLIIGAYNATYNTFGVAQAQTGAVFCFDIDSVTSKYHQTSRIDNSSSIAGFGHFVSTSGTELLVGGITSATEGAVLYSKSSGAWTAGTTFKSVSSSVYTTLWNTSKVGLGTAVAFVDQNDIVFGLPYSSNINSDTGNVLIASTTDSSTWSTEYLLRTGFINARFSGDMFGSTVSLDSNIAAIGAPGHDYQASGNPVYSGTSGAVYTYQYNSSTNAWTQNNIFTATSGSGLLGFGSLLDVSGGTMLVGTTTNNITTFEAFTQSDDQTWTQYTLAGSSNAYNSVMSVGSLALMNSTHAIVGVPRLSWPTVSYVGGFYSPQLSNGSWSMPSFTTNWSESVGYENGLYRIPLHTNGRLENGNIDYSSLMTNGRISGDGFGTSVAISPDGKTAAIGIPNCHLSYSSTISSYYGGLNTFYFDSTTNSWRFQDRWSESYLSTNNTGIGATIAFYDDTHILSTTTGSNRQTYGAMRSFSISSEDDTGSITSGNLVLENLTSTGFGASISISGNNVYYGLPTYPVYGSWNYATSTDGLTWSALSTSTSSVFTIDGIINVRNTNDNFGLSVATKNKRFWVGAPYSETDTSGVTISSNTGSVYVYDYNTTLNEKVFIEKLLPNTYGNMYFGAVIEASDDTVAISSGNLNAASTAAVSVFSYTADNTSTKLVDLVKSSIETSQPFGSAIGIMDSTNIVVTDYTSNIIDARFLDDTGAQVNSQIVSAAKISSVNNREFTLSATSILSQAFGSDIASGDGFVAIGIPNWSQSYNGNYYTSGAVAIYSKGSNGTFDLEAILADDYINSDTSGLQLGNVIGADNDTVIIGTPMRLNNAGGYLIYKRSSDGLWDLVKSYRFDATAMYNGASVAVQGGTAVIGTTNVSGLINQTPLTNSGMFNVLSNIDNTWASFESKNGDNAPWYPTSASIIYSNSPTSYYNNGGGGGSGLRGGSVYEVSYDSSIGGGGGSNLVPAGGSSEVGSFYTPPAATDTDIGSAATGGVVSTTTGGSGGNARIVINDGITTSYFDFTGEDQVYTVPAGVSSITVKLWGAGGGAGYNTLSATPDASLCAGGAGGFVTGTLAVTAGEDLTLVVGQGGIGGGDYSEYSMIPAPAYGGGGSGGCSAITAVGGSGGGRAEILRGSTSLAIAAGGGGGAVATGPNVWGVISCGTPGGYVLSGTNNLGTNIAVTGNANTRGAGDVFGVSIVQPSATEIIVGAPGHSYDNYGQALPSDSGAFMVYTRGDSKWDYQYKVNSSTPVSSGFFGAYLSTNGDTLVSLGTFFTISYTPLSYSYSPGTKTLQTFIKTDNVWTANSGITSETSYQSINNATMITDTQLVSGMPFLASTPTSASVSGSGGFVTFDYASNNWSVSTYNVAPGLSNGRQASDNFGTQVYMGSNWVAASAPHHAYSSDSLTQIANRGAAFIFHIDITTSKYVFESKLFNTASSSYFNNSGMNMTYSKGTLTLYSTNSTNTEMSNWTRSNNAFGNLTTGSIDIANISSVAAMDQNRFIFGLDTGLDYNNMSTGYWNYIASNSSINTGVYKTRIVAPGYSNGRQALDNFGTGVALLEDSNVIAITAPGQDYTETGATLSRSGAIYTFYIPAGSTDNEYVYETKIYNTGSQTTSMTSIDSKGSSILTYGISGTASLFTRTRIGSWTLENSVTDSSLLSATLSTPNLFGIGHSTSFSSADIAAVSGSGSVQFYYNSSSTWTSLPELYAIGLSNTRMGLDNFGTTIAQNANYAFIAAPNHAYSPQGNKMKSTGSVFIYSRIADSMEIVDMVVKPNDSAVTGYGTILAVADDNSYYAVGSPSENTVYVFSFDGSSSTLVASIVPPSDVGTVTSTTEFGASVAIQNQDLLIGVPGMTDGTAITGGIARYTNDSGTWTYVEMLSEFVNDTTYDSLKPSSFTSTNISTPEGDLLGTKVAINKDRGAMFSAPGNTTDQEGNNPVSGAGSAWFQYLG